MSQFGNIIFIVWRESIEALLVIGILHAWLGQQDAAAMRRGRLFLWSGVAAGLAAAALLGAVIILFSDALDDDAHQGFQTVLMLVAAGLIVQMVLWMRRHGRTLKRDIETSLQGAANRSSWWGVFLLSAIAVAREGSETVVFLAGTLSAARSSSLGLTILSIGAGLVIAIATYALLQVGSRVLTWRTFFRITEVMLLLLAAALVVTAFDNLVGLGVVPRLSGRLWDTSSILNDGGVVGKLFAALTGYRARPDLTQVGVYLLYWISIAWLLWRPVAKPR
jgi:high-affinity iron transporter